MYNQGDILLVPVPFTDLSTQKKRPVLVMSKQGYNYIADDLIVIAITSLPDAKPYAVLLTNRDMKDGVLKVDSYIRADKIYTLSQSLIIRRFGKVKQNIVETVKEKILDIMGESSQIG